MTERDGIPEGCVDALNYCQRSLGRSLAEARGAAGLYHAELAVKMGVPVKDVLDAEEGRAMPSEAFVRSWLEACGLSGDWKG